jgi:hypothetical protein
METMSVVKRSVSFGPEVWAQVARVTGAEGTRVSALVNDALVYYLRLRAGLEAVREWEAEYGELTPEELAEADRLLDGAGVYPGPSAASWPG